MEERIISGKKNGMLVLILTILLLLAGVAFIIIGIITLKKHSHSTSLIPRLSSYWDWARIEHLAVIPLLSRYMSAPRMLMAH